MINVAPLLPPGLGLALPENKQWQSSTNDLLVSCCFCQRTNSSFIHIEHLYSAPSRKLLRGAPDSSTPKKNSLKGRKEHMREGPRENAKLQREALSSRGIPFPTVAEFNRRLVIIAV